MLLVMSVHLHARWELSARDLNARLLFNVHTSQFSDWWLSRTGFALGVGRSAAFEGDGTADPASRRRARDRRTRRMMMMTRRTKPPPPAPAAMGMTGSPLLEDPPSLPVARFSTDRMTGY